MVLKERGNYLQKIAVAPCPGARIQINIASLAFACIFEPPFPHCTPKSNYQLY
ncbi:hypothetical protein CLOM621_05855 [Clostridium sp. M62/1]|nr:hypothetical protein CLOM621_05855 [Clostridium sp. M62/1]